MTRAKKIESIRNRMERGDVTLNKKSYINMSVWFRNLKVLDFSMNHLSRMVGARQNEGVWESEVSELDYLSRRLSIKRSRKFDFLHGNTGLKEVYFLSWERWHLYVYWQKAPFSPVLYCLNMVLFIVVGDLWRLKQHKMSSR